MNNPSPDPLCPFVVTILLNNSSLTSFGIPPALSATDITIFSFSLSITISMDWFSFPLYAWIAFCIKLLTTCTKALIFPIIEVSLSILQSTFNVIKAFFNSCFINILTLLKNSSNLNTSVVESLKFTACPLTAVIISDIYES